MEYSASVVTACWGTRYQPYIARWWESIRNLNRWPDEVVLVTDLADESNLLDSVPSWVEFPVVKVQIDSSSYNKLWSTAVHASSKEWIVKLCIDDQFCYEALDFLEGVEGDLVIDSCKFLQGGEWVPTWDTEATHNRRFAPASFSPFRQNLIPIYDQIPDPCIWDDYVFYLLLVKSGVKVYRTDGFRMVHDLGLDHQTMSGLHRDPNQAGRGDENLAQLRDELGI